MFTLIAIITF